MRIERLQDESGIIASQIELESKKNKDLTLLIALSKEEIGDNNKQLNKADGTALPQLQNK